MSQYIIKLGNEYLITETIFGKPGKIIKGPGVKFLNPLTQRPKEKKTATGPELAQILEARGKSKNRFRLLERIPVRQTIRLGNLSFHTLDNVSGNCEIHCEFWFPSVKDVYKYYWIKNKPKGSITKYVHTRIVDAISHIHSSQFHNGHYIPNIVRELSDQQGTFHQHYGVLVSEILITQIKI